MKVQNEMATRISVDTISAITSMRDFRNAVSATSAAWRAQESVLKSSGQYSDALKTRISGLSQTIDIQKAKIAELRSQQEGLNQENSKQRSQWLNLEKQISQANRQLAGYEVQLDKAKSNSTYYTSGLSEMQHQYRLNVDVAKSFVSSLRAQGRTYEANKSEAKSLVGQIADLGEQQSKQRHLLQQIAIESGRTSDAYKKQEIQLNHTTEEIGKAKSRMAELNRVLNPPKPSTWSWIRNNILQVDKAEQKAKNSVINYGQALKANIMGGWIQQGFSTITGELKSMVTNGMAVAKAGAAMEARWKNIDVSASGIKKLSAQVTDLKTNTNLSAQAVNGLQTRFYGMTHSISQTTTLTKGVASLTDQLKLSDQQANAFAGGLSRIESSGKVTGQSLGRLEKQAPGLTAALSKASGMSQKSFKDLVSSGKMTSDQFNDILAKASKDYDKNAKAFGQTSGGALHKLQQEWASTQAKLAKPLLKVSATGLNELSQALNNKDTQKGLEVLAKNMAKAAVAAAKFIGYIAKHQQTVKIFGRAILGLTLGFKAMQTTVMAVDVVKKFKDLKAITRSFKALGVAIKVATAGFNPWVIGVELVVGALAILYTHSKTFRKMCRDMGKLAVKAGKAIVKGFKAVINWFKSDWKQIALFLVNPIAGGIALLYKHNKTFRKFVNNLAKDARTGLRKVGNFFKSAWRGIERTSSRAWKNQQRENRNGLRDAQRTWNQMSRNVSRTSKSMWQRASRDARNGWNYVARWGNRSSKGIARTWDWMNRQTTRASQRMFRSHERTFRAGYRVIEDQTKTWKDLTSGHWDRLYDDTSKTARDMNKYHQRLFKDMYNKLNDMTGGRLGDMLKTWQDKMSSIGDAVANAKQAIHTHFVDLVRGVIKPFNDMLAGIQKGINWVLDKIGASKIGGNWQVPMPSYAQGTLGAHPGGFAKVNDGKTGHYREMYKLPNGVVGMFPAVRDMIVPLPKGTAILDGEKTYSFMRMMGKIPHYATGTLDAVGNFFGNLKDDVESFMDNIDKFIDHPVELMESVFKKFIRVSTPIKFATDMIQHFPVYVAQQMKNWLKKQLEEFSGPNGGAASEGLIRRAAAMMHVHPSDAFIHNLMQVIMNESGNRSVMQTIHDMNSGGNEAGGILQYTPGTFATYAMPGHTNRMNPLDELLAFFNNSDWENSIGWTTIWGHRKMEWLHSGPQGHRRLSHFANGGLVNTHQLIEIAEGNKPEYVIPTDINKRSRAYQLLGEIIARFQADEPAQAHINSGYGKKIDQLNAKFDRLLDMFGQLLGATDNQTQAIQAQGSLDTKQLYKKMARDKAMRQFG